MVCIIVIHIAYIKHKNRQNMANISTLTSNNFGSARVNITFSSISLDDNFWSIWLLCYVVVLVFVKTVCNRFNGFRTIFFYMLPFRFYDSKLDYYPATTYRARASLFKAESWATGDCVCVSFRKNLVNLPLTQREKFDLCEKQTEVSPWHPNC